MWWAAEAAKYRQGGMEDNEREGGEVADGERTGWWALTIIPRNYNHISAEEIMEREERKLKVISGESHLRNQNAPRRGVWGVCFKDTCVFCAVMECD